MACGRAKGGQAYMILLFTLSAFTTFSLEDFLCLKLFVYFINPHGLQVSLSSTSSGSLWVHIIFCYLQSPWQGVHCHPLHEGPPPVVSGCNSFIWWALVHALVETVASPYCWSYPWFCTHQLCIPWFFFPLCQTEESQPPQLFLIGCSLVLLLPFPNSVYPEMSTKFSLDLSEI